MRHEKEVDFTAGVIPGYINLVHLRLDDAIFSIQAIRLEKVDQSKNMTLRKVKHYQKRKSWFALEKTFMQILTSIQVTTNMFWLNYLN